jgi:LuxR family maltose regulon positive regulatory protein
MTHSATTVVSTERAAEAITPDSGVPELGGVNVVRMALLDRLRAAPEARVILVSAPAGSGKTTFLSQWAHDDARPATWLSMRPAHADPAVLVGDLARAIARGAPGGAVAQALPTLKGSDAYRALARLSRALEHEERGSILILDDLQAVRDERSLDIVTALVDRIPSGWQLGIGTREDPPFPTARWRLAGSLLSLGFTDLALDRDECRSLLDALGAAVTDGVVGEVHHRTEGWVVGVYLAGLAIRSGTSADRAPVAGDQDLIRSYLESEVLAGTDRGSLELLLRTSILESVSGSLADALTDRQDSAERLDRLARANLLVLPLDGSRRWFRYHSLLRDLLARKLEDREPGRSDLHRRAAAWYESEGRIEEAVDQAFLGGDVPTAARLVEAATQSIYQAGLVTTVRRWMERFPEPALAERPQLAALAALVAALEGDPLEAVRWGRYAVVEPAKTTFPVDPGGLDASAIRAMLCADGPALMLADAERSLAAHDLAWPWLPTASLAAGAAHAMLGDEAAAQARYEAVERSPAVRTALARLPARAERALAAMARRSWPDAEAILALDRAAVLGDPEAGRTAGVVWLVADARLSLHRGDLRGGRERLRRAQVGRVYLTWAIPWFAVRTLAELARAQLLAGDGQGARASLAQAREVLAARPKLGVLAGQVDELTERALQTPPARAEGSTLSPAELRLLPLLQTYLSFKEMGARLGISSNTVKTEAMSIYAKLGAASRSEAVDRAVACGLLEDTFA